MGTMAHFSRVTLVVFLCSIGQTACEVYYIAKTSNECWTSPCLTLSQFSDNSSQYLSSNTTLVFLSGRHHLPTTLMVSNQYCLSMVSENSTAQIECVGSAHVVFDFFHCVHITNLQFIGCGGNQVKNVKELIVQDTMFQGRMKSGSAIQLTETTAKMVNTTFLSSVGTASCDFYPIFGCIISGGAVYATNSKIDFIQSIFRNNNGSALYANNTTIVVDRCVFIRNFAYMPDSFIISATSEEEFQREFYSNGVIKGQGGVLFSYNSSITIQASKISHNHATFSGGVLYSNISNITIEESTFDHNFDFENGGVLCSYNSYIGIEKSEFYENFAFFYGGVLYSKNSTIKIETSEFVSNHANDDGGVLHSDSSFVRIVGSLFDGNYVIIRGGVLFSSIDLSDVKVSNSSFAENRSPIGAGVHAIDNSVDQPISELLYITTASVDLCTSPCLTLSQFAIRYASLSSYYLNSNITLIFLPGRHYLTVDLTISNLDNFSVNSENLTTQILCMDYSNILFLYSQHVEIANLEFIGCGGNQVINVKEFVVQDTIFRGQNNSETSLELIRTTGKIFNTTFVSNNKGKCRAYVLIGPQVANGPTFVGGAIIGVHSVIDISQSTFESNKKVEIGGALFAEHGSFINVRNSIFINNQAWQGGVLHSSCSNIMIESTGFVNNAGSYGGVLSSYNSNIRIETSDFHSNIATQEGGVLDFSASNITISDSYFTNNNSSTGAVIYAIQGSKLECNNTIIFANNSADKFALIYSFGSEVKLHHSGTVIFSNNLGSLVAFNSNITFMGYITFVNNQPLQTTINSFQEGGAITLIQSNAFLDGTCEFQHNQAENGGAIYATESKLFVNSDVTIASNKATRNGGGVYLLNSELNCQRESTFVLLNNTAMHKGGGVHAISSTIKATSDVIFNYDSRRFGPVYTGTRLKFIKNVAEKGGGLSLEANAKLYVQIVGSFFNPLYEYDRNATIFLENIANYGGAVYVDDDTNSGTCVSVPKIECFFQVLDLTMLYGRSTYNTQNIHFSQNHAHSSGSILYGGLLDRCAVSPFADVHHSVNKQYLNDESEGITYFKEVAFPTSYKTYNFEEIQISISSRPVKVCLCPSGEHHCTNQLQIKVKKGETFSVPLVAVDQIGQPVNGSIQASLIFSESGLDEGQLTREIPGECTNLTFSVVSPHTFEELKLYASDGPCKDAELSKMTVVVHFLPCSCPVGFQVSGNNETNCTCECHHDISRYVVQCDSVSGSLLKLPQSRAWISYINDTDQTGFLVYSHCPFDYCNSLSPPLNLNQPNGADTQCAYDRSSLLCGACQHDLSLSLGSSHCLVCPSYWPVLFVTITIAAILAGIALVALLLVLNMTVAIGTLNGLIFYVNIVYANKSILLPFQETNFVTVFISWLNLELGIDTCYFPGMDTYTKTWLQLVFPAYVILLVALVIIISAHSFRFSNLIGKKDPVATLSTLILLSYARVLEISFRSLSVGILQYPDGSNELLWLPDATVRYLSGKHIPLFIAAVLLLLVGLGYTVLLFSWQWLLYLPKWRIFWWLRGQKVKTFIDTYHIPYAPKHRYWTGLLLLVRAVLYLVTAVNVSNNPQIALTAIIFSVCSIVFLGRLIHKGPYRKWPVDALETFFHINILYFALFTWYFLGDTKSTQEAVAYTSVITTFVALTLIIFYHVYTYTRVFSKGKETKCGRALKLLFSKAEPEPKVNSQSSLVDDDNDRFHELIDLIDHPINTSDYQVKQTPPEPTQSVVEIGKPQNPPVPKKCEVNK